MKPYVFICVTVCLKFLVANDLFPCQPVSFNKITFQQCSDECFRRPACQSVTYIRGATVCHLHETLSTACDSFSWKSKQFFSVVSWNVTNWRLQNEGQLCQDRTCMKGEVCDKEDGLCKISECPVPPSIPETRRNGNLRHVGSKVKYSCMNHFAPPMYSECQANGTWTAVNMECEIPGYDFHGDDTYMLNGFGNLLASFNLHPVDLAECLDSCNKKVSFCIGVNYFAKNMTCVSSSLQPHANTADEPLSLEGWRFYSKTLPIYIPKTVAQTKYDYTYQDALALCEAFNTTLATEQDVLNAFNLGYTMCKCGWVVGKYSVISLQFTEINCFDNTQHGVFECWEASKFSLYCKNPN